MAEYAVTSRHARYLARVADEEPGLRVSVDGQAAPLRVEPVAPGVVRIGAGPAAGLATVRRAGDEVIVTIEDARYRLRVEPAVPIARRAPAGRSRSADLRAPIPGLIVSVGAVEGEVVEQGRPLVVMEAMKMQSELLAPVAGRVAAVHVRPGQEVMGGAILVTVAPAGADDGAR